MGDYTAPSIGALTSLGPAFAPNTDYNKGDVVSYNGGNYAALTTFTSGASFNPANWLQVGVANQEYVSIGASENVLPTATSVLTSTSITGDTYDRIEVLADGTLNWGGGSGGIDVSLSHAGGGLMRWDIGNAHLFLAESAQGALVQLVPGAATQQALSFTAAASQSADLLDILASDGTTKLAFFTASGGLGFSPATTTTSPSAGSAGGLPALPAGYLTVNINGADHQIAYY